MRKLTSVLALCAALAATRTALAVIAAGDNQFGPSTVSLYDGNQNTGFSVVEDVSYDGSAGQWLKKFRNDGTGPAMGQIFSGTYVHIDEQFLHAVNRHRLACTQQSSFEDSLGLISIHNDVVCGSCN